MNKTTMSKGNTCIWVGLNRIQHRSSWARFYTTNTSAEAIIEVHMRGLRSIHRLSPGQLSLGTPIRPGQTKSPVSFTLPANQTGLGGQSWTGRRETKAPKVVGTKHAMQVQLRQWKWLQDTLERLGKGSMRSEFGVFCNVVFNEECGNF